MPMFKVGDFVRIRNDIDVNLTYDNDVLCAEGMEKYKGQVCKVEGYVYDGNIIIGYKLDTSEYIWSDSMLELPVTTTTDDGCMVNDEGVASKQDHYKKASMQPIQFCQALMTYEQFDGFLLGQVIKYKCRENFKGQKTSDINKARQYLYWLKLHREGHTIDPVKDSVPDSFEYTGV